MIASVNTQLQDTSTAVAANQASAAANLDRINRADITAVIAGANPTDPTFDSADVDVSGNSVTSTAHGLTTGVKITELTTTGVLPAGLSAATVYYAIVVDADTLKFATSQANALAGTAVDITDVGSGTHTVVIATTLAGTIKLQKNNNPPHLDAVWVDLLDDEIQGTATASNTISAAATFNWSVPDFAARQLRAITTITSGTVTADIRLHGKA